MTTHNTKVADLYLRVSTDDQEDNASLEVQERDCLEYAETHGIVVANIYKEVYTGTLYRERKLLSAMRERYRNGTINAVIVRNFDRLSRNQTHFAVLIDEMQQHRTELLCVKEQLDNSPMGQFVRAAYVFTAEVERAKIVDRTIEGKRMRATNGSLIPGRMPLYGYNWPSRDDKTRYVVNEAQAFVVRRIYVLYLEGYSTYRITQILQEEGHETAKGGAWSDSSVRKILHNRAYIGEAYAYKYSQSGQGPLAIRPLEEQIPLPEGIIPAIISLKDFEAVQARMLANSQNSTRNNKTSQETLLRSGFVQCGYCGSNLAVGITSTKKYHYPDYHCYKASEANKKCRVVKIYVSRLDTEVWAYLEELAHNVKVISQAIDAALSQNTFIQEIQALQKSIDSWQETCNQYTLDLCNPALRGKARDVVLSELSNAEERLNNLQKELSIVEQGQVDYATLQEEYKKIQAWCQKLRYSEEQPEALSYKEKRDFLRLIGVKVLLYRENDTNHQRWEIQLSLPTIAP